MEDSTKRILFFTGCSVVALGTAGYFGYKHYQKMKAEKEATSEVEANVDASSYAPVTNDQSSSGNTNSGFPLKRGSRGTNVKKLQEALIAKYGASILPKYKNDGVFGSEMEAALKLKGYPIIVNKNMFTDITGIAVGAIETEQLMISTKPALVWKSIRHKIMVGKGVILGTLISQRGKYIVFRARDKKPYLIQSDAVRLVENISI